MSNVSPTDNTSVALISAAQTLTGSWADLGNIIDIRDIKNIALWLSLDVNDSTGVQFRAQVYTEKTGTTAYDLPIASATTAKVSLTVQVYEFGANSDQKLCVPVEILDVVPYCKFQVKATVAGASAGQILAAAITFDSPVGR